MVEFNLLPWRRQKQEYEQKVLIKTLLQSLLITMLILLSVHFHLNRQHALKFQSLLTASTKQESAAEYEEASTADMSVVAWQNAQTSFLQLLDNIATAKNQLCLQSVDINPSGVTLSGIASSFYVLTYFLQSWPYIKNLQTLVLQRLQQQAGHIVFELRANQQNVALAATDDT